MAEEKLENLQQKKNSFSPKLDMKNLLFSI